MARAATHAPSVYLAGIAATATPEERPEERPKGRGAAAWRSGRTQQSATAVREAWWQAASSRRRGRLEDASTRPAACARQASSSSSTPPPPAGDSPPRAISYQGPRGDRWGHTSRRRGQTADGLTASPSFAAPRPNGSVTVPCGGWGWKGGAGPVLARLCPYPRRRPCAARRAWPYPSVGP